MCDFHSLSYSCISWSCLLTLFLWHLRTDISDPLEDYRAKGNILRSKWERRFLRNYFVICEFISQSYSFPFKKPFTKTVPVKFESDIWKPMEVYSEKLNASDKNWKEAFWETALCSVNSSHRVTSFPSRNLSLRLFLWNWQRDIWKPIEGYGERGNIFRSKLERSFLRNCSVFC